MKEGNKKIYSFKLYLEKIIVAFDIVSAVSNDSIMPDGTMINIPSKENVNLLKNDLNVSS